MSYRNITTTGMVKLRNIVLDTLIVGILVKIILNKVYKEILTFINMLLGVNLFQIKDQVYWVG